MAVQKHMKFQPKNLKRKLLSTLLMGSMISTLMQPTNIFAKENSSTYSADTTEITTSENEDCANSWRYKNGVPISNNNTFRIAASNKAWTKVNGNYVSSDGKTVIPNATKKGIDVSHYQGEIDWEQISDSSDIDFAILRCGYGQDITSQDDKYWTRNATECTDYGIPFGAYIYSYATTEKAAIGEAEHVLRLVKDYDLSYPIYYDLEDKKLSSLSASQLAKIATAFCNTIEDAGYEAGIYANLNWFNNKLTNSVFDDWDRWVAQYNVSCNYKKDYTMWQCTSDGTVPGINGRVDLNFIIGDEPLTEAYDIGLDNNSLSLSVEETSKLTATIFPLNAFNKNISWSSDNPQIATVNSNGTITAVASGNATITATAKSNSNVTVSCKVTIQDTTSPEIPVISQTPDPAGSPIASETPDPVGSPIASETPDPVGSPIASETPDPVGSPIASETPDPVGSPIASETPDPAGSPIVNETPDPAGSPIASETPDPVGSPIASETPDPVGSPIVSEIPDPVASPIISETPNPTGTPAINVTTITLNTANTEVIQGKTIQLTADTFPIDAVNSKISWSSSNTNIATVSSNGKITAKKPGIVIIKASAGSNIFASCTVKILPKPTSSFTYTAKSTNSIKLTWKKVSDISGYLLYRYDSSKKKDVLIDTLSSSKTSYTFNKTKGKKGSSLSAGTKYKFKICAYKTVNKSKICSKKIAITTCTKPGTPTLKSVKQHSSQPKLTWKRVKSSDGYIIYISKKRNGTYKDAKSILSNKILTTKLNNCKKGTTYYIKIRTYKKVNGTLIYGAFSKVKSIRLK